VLHKDQKVRGKRHAHPRIEKSLSHLAAGIFDCAPQSTPNGIQFTCPRTHYNSDRTARLPSLPPEMNLPFVLSVVTVATLRSCRKGSQPASRTLDPLGALAAGGICRTKPAARATIDHGPQASQRLVSRHSPCTELVPDAVSPWQFCFRTTNADCEGAGKLENVKNPHRTNDG
jgi:hypothetical protein